LCHIVDSDVQTDSSLELEQETAMNFWGKQCGTNIEFCVKDGYGTVAGDFIVMGCDHLVFVHFYMTVLCPLR